MVKRVHMPLEVHQSYREGNLFNELLAQPIYISYCGFFRHKNQIGFYILIWRQVKFHYKHKKEKEAVLH